MPSNLALFQSQLAFLLNSKKVKSVDEFADKFSTLLDNSIKYQASTLFGNVITSTNKDLIKNGMKLALDIGYKVEKYKIELDKILQEIQVQSKDLQVLISTLQKIPIPLFSNYIKDYLKKVKDLPDTEKIESIREYIKKIKIEDLMWFFVASQISAYYLTAQFSTLPPNPPSTSPSVGVIITSPGNIMLLATGLKFAFKAKTADETASKCKLAIETYTKTISGIYTGVTPTGAPSVTPWIGIF